MPGSVSIKICMLSPTEIETEDRIGLLYTISQTLTELALDISAAKICTERGAALDSFYVRELSGGKVLDPERQRAIKHHLCHAFQTLDLQPQNS